MVHLEKYRTLLTKRGSVFFEGGCSDVYVIDQAEDEIVQVR